MFLRPFSFLKVLGWFKSLTSIKGKPTEEKKDSYEALQNDHVT